MHSFSPSDVYNQEMLFYKSYNLIVDNNKQTITDLLIKI